MQTDKNKVETQDKLLFLVKQELTEKTKMPVVFFNDLGFRAFANSDFNFNLTTGSRSRVFENYIYRLLTDTLPPPPPPPPPPVKNINYWRTIGGAEVDFVIGSYHKPVPVEAKMKKFDKKPIFGKSFYSFLGKYKPEKAYLYNLDSHKQTKIKNTKVTPLPYYLPISTE